MIFKKKFLILIIFLIIIFQILLYANNNQRTTFKYFNWTLQDTSIGKLISIPFFSGLFIGMLLSSTTSSYKINTSENKDENNYTLNNEGDKESNVEIPPQRDIRDAQPTISVNYRVVKNSDENNFKRAQSYSDNADNRDDWENQEDDW